MGKPSDKAVKFRKPKADPDAPKPKRRSEHNGMNSMPRQVTYHKKLGAAARMVAAFLYDHQSPGGCEATGSYEFIAEEMNLSRMTVVTAVKELYSNHIIMGIEKRANGAGGYFNVYKLRTYDYPKLRDASKVLSMEKKLNKSEKVARDLKKKIEAGTIGTDDGPPLPCPVCAGTKWERVPGSNAVKPCSACRKSSKGEKPQSKN